ncbi:MAG: hypothetical protein C6Y22_08295 [Hapalosiphonaceae cyanobacterium JJU2]|nr:MAG: hypothetical protein C6Y22_08295 [Hapalosiphonaceae cyanobacterium JJU2]
MNLSLNELTQAIARTKTDLANASAHLERLRGERTALEEQRRSRMDEVGLVVLQSNFAGSDSRI